MTLQTTPREFPERDLCRAAAEHLRADGWKVFSEIPYFERSIDLVGVRDGLVFGIEAKVSFTKRLQSQIMGVSWHTDYAAALVKTVPRAATIAWAERHGIGIWRVLPGGEIAKIVKERSLRERFGDEACPSSDLIRERILRNVSIASESDDGGMPCVSGSGPAQGVEQLCKAYREKHPRATWEELFANVPNHYSSANSMRSAFNSNRQLRAKRARKKAAKAARAAALAVQPASSGVSPLT